MVLNRCAHKSRVSGASFELYSIFHLGLVFAVQALEVGEKTFFFEKKINFFQKKMCFFQIQALVQQKVSQVEKCYISQKMRLSLYFHAPSI